jgi:NADPH-dependent 2,4-dienoyl-CoA reductase/sulfur reductase-like enzyme/rhodanese-related sulfurtransferase
MSVKKILIIGGVATGPKAAARARRLDPDAEITIVERGELLSYAGCGLPYYIEGKVENMKELLFSPIGMPGDRAFSRQAKNVKVLNRTLATAINRQEKTVEVVDLATGQKMNLPYDKLVLATGGLPVEPPIEGLNLNNVFRLNHPDHAVAIRDAATSGKIKKAVLIGGGLIGMEVTEALATIGIEVAIVEMLPHVLPLMLDQEVAAFLTKHIEDNGVEVRTGEKVLKIVEDDLGNATGVVTDKGEVEAQMVLVAIGVRPNVQLAKDAGLELGSTGAIAVNEYLQTSDPDIYAGGDCVETPHLVTGKKAFCPMGSTANKQGRVIGDNVTGSQTTYPGTTGTAVAKVFDYSVGKTGLNEREARENGYQVVTSLVPGPDRAHYYPESKKILLKMVAEAKTGRLLGLQAVGPGDAVKRIDVFASALFFKATVEDLRNVDLAYAPPYSSAIDLVAVAANIISNKINGLAKGISPVEVKEKLDRGDDFLWLDVRSPDEFKAMRIEDERVKLIPLDRLHESLDSLPRDKEIIAFCEAGQRGYEAQRILHWGGFKDVKFMDGSIVAWPFDGVVIDS